MLTPARQARLKTEAEEAAQAAAAVAEPQESAASLEMSGRDDALVMLANIPDWVGVVKELRGAPAARLTEQDVAMWVFTAVCVGVCL